LKSLCEYSFSVRKVKLESALHRDRYTDKENPVAKIGYARVSTAEQNLDRQEDALAALNLDRVFSDKMSGKTADRPGLQCMLDFIREGDVLYVEAISRLARSTKDLLPVDNHMKSRQNRHARPTY
jgi:DNA invertase Pin-like site-specific DNA recombinase